ncbi:MAG: dehydrogenase [Verrucomicrobiales bacterium]|nr:dehydrogenase [Verrucomicrobiales bacterium]
MGKGYVTGCFFMVLLACSHLCGQEVTNGIAGSDQVAEVMRTFEGRGTMADGSEPTPPTEALKRLQSRGDIGIELVLSEPQIEQPLSLAWDSRGRLWVVQYRQYQFPAGLKIIEYDNHLRARFDKVPAPPPVGNPGADVISVFEDTDGDGTLDSKKDVITGLNIATSVAIGAGGLWVANPPYLLFYPDSDGDDIPDSDPIVKLAGFGLEDTHSVMNSLTWGPDGWLYGANGSTTTGKVENPANGEVVEWLGQMIWRFHPETEEFEIYAEGGGNTFSLDIDAKGHVFSGTNNGKTRGMFYPQGSYGKKSWGKHGPLTNPYAFGYFHHMAHDGDDRRFAQAFTIEEGGLFEGDSAGRIIAPNSLHNVVWSSRLERNGSTYQTIDETNLVETDDRWFRPVYAGLGPDGAVYLADWYDTRLSHVSPIDDWHKSSGRVYRLLPEGVNAEYGEGDLRDKSANELVDLFSHPNRSVRRRALLELGWSHDPSITPRLEALVEENLGQVSLEALWALNLLGALDDERLAGWLTHDDPDIRRWCVRLAGDRRSSAEVLKEPLKSLSEVEPDIQVRVQLAASAKRFPTGLALPVIDGLLEHDDDLEDLHQPLMIWWALEAHAGPGRDELLKWVEESVAWDRVLFRNEMAGRLMRRYAMAGKPQDLASCERLLATAPDEKAKSDLLDALQLAYEGVTMPELPDGLSQALEAYAADLGENGLVIRLRNGDKEAIPDALKAVTNSSLPTGVRTELIRQLGEVDGVDVVPTLFKLFGVDEASVVKRVALQTLARFDDVRVAEGIIKRYGSTLPAEHGIRSTAELVLASRPNWAAMMMDQVDRAVIKDRDVSLDVVMLLMQHSEPELAGRVQKYWPGIVAGGGGVDLAAESERIKGILAKETGDAVGGKPFLRQAAVPAISCSGKETILVPT